MMKKYFLIVAAMLICFAQLSAKNWKEKTYTYTEASELTLFGKVFQETPFPYQRMDFQKYSGCWEKKDSTLLAMSAGVAVSFRTNSPTITVRTEFIEKSHSNASGFAARGYDLYIKKDGKWIWAGNFSASSNDKLEYTGLLVENMDREMKDCILYLPLFSSEKSILIGIEEGSTVMRGDVPFRHRICLHGSSFMHGANATRCGQTVPAHLSRMTGLQFCSLGVSGDCKMQPQFANALKDADVEAFVFDAFSNPNPKEIEERLFSFIETIQSGKPGVPLIFMSSIYRERRNFNTKVDAFEQEKAEMAEKMMQQAMKKYKDVYFIKSDASFKHETSADGIHPGDQGYYLWAASVEKQILKILKKYGIK